jgi:hypothetical protein
MFQFTAHHEIEGGVIRVIRPQGVQSERFDFPPIMKSKEPE